MLERTPIAFSAATQLPALVTARRNGQTYLACVDKSSSCNGHLFARVQYADGQVQWANATNIVEVV